MANLELNTSLRTTRGRQAARGLRRGGLIPAVCYGKNTAPTSLTLSPKDLEKALTGPYGRNALIDLKVDNGVTYEVMLKDHQKNAVTRQVTHVDFFVVDHTVKVQVNVPIILVGKAKGVAAGGSLRQVERMVTVRCLPKDMPMALEFDVTPLGVKQSAKVSTIPTPEGVELVFAIDFAFVQILPPRGAETVVADAAE
ncbi:MAG: hypothetical protein AUK47_07470 [Deltaproteobacteria bacterium CG2_30_63_29]|nr:MAG: hypothetical protein AUK47_07470 [Deltaproteobacteria bacterium CG2_30_63_29]PJB37092.1 MAG: 50S ribosomal protein L25 [Deltaproteobacteria bacterium CG_4_9_14_3_um_filter_63_12]